MLIALLAFFAYPRPSSSLPATLDDLQQNVHWWTQLGYNRRYILCSVVEFFSLIVFVEGLREYFSQFGKVDACTIMRDAAGRSRCFAFLTFEDPASVNAVMVREHILDGKIVRYVLTLHSTMAYIASRSTLNVPSPGKSTNVQLSCSSVDCPEV